MARPRKHDGVLFQRANSAFWWMRYRDNSDRRIEESTGTSDWKEANQKLRDRLQCRDDNVLQVVRKGEKLSLAEWSKVFLENHSKPPLRSAKTHEANTLALGRWCSAIGHEKLGDISADMIEALLRRRLRQRVRRKTRAGFVEKGVVKPSTVHQEFRVLRRALNVAVRKKALAANPCFGVEFPVAVKGLFRPHYMSWSEQQRIEAEASVYLRSAIRIITETGLRVYKELTPMRKEQIDLDNAVVWIPDSKTPSGVAEVPLTAIAVEAFRTQMAIAGPSAFLFPRPTPEGHQKTFKTSWPATLRRAKVSHFRIYDLRSTYATRLSAGGVADEWVTQLLRQGDAKVFKKYSQMKLQMKREALEKMNRHANEAGRVLRQVS